MAKKKLNPAARRSRIAMIDALISLMQEKSFRKIRIQELTDRADLSRQTLYTNFTSKEDILKFALEKLFEMFEENEQDLDVDDYLKMYFSYWQQHTILLDVLFKQSLDYLFLEKNIAFFHHKENWLKTHFYNVGHEDIYLNDCLATLTYTLLRTWVLNEQKEPIEMLADIGMKLLQGTYCNQIKE